MCKANHLTCTPADKQMLIVEMPVVSMIFPLREDASSEFVFVHRKTEWDILGELIVEGCEDPCFFEFKISYFHWSHRGVASGGVCLRVFRLRFWGLRRAAQPRVGGRCWDGYTQARS